MAFLVQCQGKRIYHAGDLNCWVWDGAPGSKTTRWRPSTKRSWNRWRPTSRGSAPAPRQEADFDLGMKYFFQAGGAEYVFPMHM